MSTFPVFAELQVERRTLYLAPEGSMARLALYSCGLRVHLLPGNVTQTHRCKRDPIWRMKLLFSSESLKIHILAPPVTAPCGDPGSSQAPRAKAGWQDRRQPCMRPLEGGEGSGGVDHAGSTPSRTLVQHPKANPSCRFSLKEKCHCHSLR